MQAPPTRRWLAPLLIACVALAASVSGIGNRWAQDDTALIEEDTRVHSLANWRQAFTEPYWPPPATPDLYRPLATLSFAAQWAIGGGSPVVFRITSYLLYILVSLAVYHLARRLLPGGIAIAVALLFAAHPVHVEAVALGVNQGEQWVGLLSVIATIRYLDVRRHGWLGPWDWLGMGLLYLLACLFKEHAVVLPGFLIAAELTILSGQTDSLGTRIARLWVGFAGLALIGAGFLAVRSAVLDDVVGSFTAEALDGQSIAGRCLTMLQVVPHYFRLLLWPSRLSGDYSPAEISPAQAWGPSQWIGTALLISIFLVMVRSRSRLPGLSFGLTCAMLALFPVSNILVPTGIVLAERSLFLPSVWALLALGTAVARIPASAPGSSGRGGLLTILLALLVGLGIIRSALRHRDYRNELHYWVTTAETSPKSYRAHYAVARLMWNLGQDSIAATAHRRSIALYPQAYWIQNSFADRLRGRGHCEAAVRNYEESIAKFPWQTAARASLIACQIHLGRYAVARRTAIQAAETEYPPGRLRERNPVSEDDFRYLASVADSAAAVHAPAGTVRVHLRAGAEP